MKKTVIKVANDRRTFLKTVSLFAAGIGLTGMNYNIRAASGTKSITPNADKLGWRIGVHSYSFRNFSLYESIEKTAAMGLRYLGAYPTQKLSAGESNVQVSETLTAGTLKEIKRRLADAGLEMPHFGVCGFDQGADKFRAVFDFAAELGVETILAEPPEDAFDALDKLCLEYKIGLAIHNHPKYRKGSRYWNPDLVLNACAGRSKRMGACADNGHWMRSELDPVECLKKLDGRLLALHFKDMDVLGEKGHCVPFGTGVCDVKGMFSEIYCQQAKPVFMIEYEYNWANNIPDIERSILYFDSVAGELLASTTTH